MHATPSNATTLSLRGNSSSGINRATATSAAAPTTEIAAATSVGTSIIATVTTIPKAIALLSTTLAPNDRIYGRDR